MFCRSVQKAIAFLNANQTEDTKLHFYNINLGDAGEEGIKAFANALASNTSLTTLFLGNNNLGNASDEGLIELFNAIACNTSLTSLYLAENDLSNASEEALIALANAIARNTSLTTLSLEGNNLGNTSEKALKALFKAIASNASLTKLYLGENNLGNASADTLIALANAIARNTSLTALDLDGNNLGNASADTLIALANAIARNTSLTALDLDGNNLGNASEEVLIALFKAIASNTSLTLLFLQENSLENVSKKGLIALANAIASNTSLTKLYLDNNNLGNASEEGFITLTNAIASNTSLTELSLSRNNLCNASKGALIALSKAIENNTSLIKLRFNVNGLPKYFLYEHENMRRNQLIAQSKCNLAEEPLEQKYLESIAKLEELAKVEEENKDGPLAQNKPYTVIQDLLVQFHIKLYQLYQTATFAKAEKESTKLEKAVEHLRQACNLAVEISEAADKTRADNGRDPAFETLCLHQNIQGDTSSHAQDKKVAVNQAVIDALLTLQVTTQDDSTKLAAFANENQQLHVDRFLQEAADHRDALNLQNPLTPEERFVAYGQALLHNIKNHLSTTTPFHTDKEAQESPSLKKQSSASTDFFLKPQPSNPAHNKLACLANEACGFMAVDDIDGALTNLQTELNQLKGEETQTDLPLENWLNLCELINHTKPAQITTLSHRQAS